MINCPVFSFRASLQWNQKRPSIRRFVPNPLCGPYNAHITLPHITLDPCHSRIAPFGSENSVAIMSEDRIENWTTKKIRSRKDFGFLPEYTLGSPPFRGDSNLTFTFHWHAVLGKVRSKVYKYIIFSTQSHPRQFWLDIRLKSKIRKWGWLLLVPFWKYLWSESIQTNQQNQ